MAYSERKDYFAKQILSKVVLIPLFFVLCTIPWSTAFAATVTLAWDPSPVSNIAGYNVYYGTASGNYTNKVSVGKVTSCSVPNLTEGRRYYFAATAFNTSNAESARSNELAYTVPTASSSSTSGSGTTGTTTGSSGSIIIDNGGTGTTSSGTWYNSGAANYYGSKSVYSSAASATYTFEATRSGPQKVYLWWTQYSNRCDNVAVDIYDGTTRRGTVTVNQKVNGGRWNEFGPYTFSSKARVVIKSTGGCTTSADAVQFASAGTTTSSGSTSGSGTSSSTSSSGTTSTSGSTSSSGTTSTSGSTSGSTSSGTSGSSGSIIIDNGNSGTTASGTWYNSGGAGYYGTKSVYSSKMSSSYTFQAARSGSQKVYLWWTYTGNRYSAVPVNIYNGSTLIDTIYVDQSIEKDSGSWQLLGTYGFSGQAKVVIVSNSSSKTTCADAVQFVPGSATTSSGSTSSSSSTASTSSTTSSAAGGSSGSIIIDTGDPGTKASGSWKTSGGVGFYGSKSLYSSTASDTYSFEASCSGLQEVYLWWTEYGNRCKSVDVDIYDGTKYIDTVTVNQYVNGGQWNALGTFSFSGKAKVIINSTGGCTTSADAVNFFDPN